MLKLERMEISGFKSFSDRTEVRFPEGITAVVGPNGCGKSNIGDALNWALGEQSPRMLRGKQMADVIFSGSRARKPLGMAEVSIHLGGAAGLPFVDQGKIVVTRRLFRSGESDYLINGKRARLKDIQELLDQARVGARSYATIEQGKIDQILNAKPKDRRQIIEDAAGIAGYKHKRRLTELKLEATHANLLRVNDIVVEIERQIRSLKRQAGKARRYRRLREELRQNERTRFGIRALQMDAELDQLRQAENANRDREAEAAALASRIEVELIGDREALEQQNRAFREASEGLHQLELEIDRGEGQIATCKERITELEQLSRRQDGESEALATRQTEMLERANRQRSLVERGKAELEALTDRLAEQQQALKELERHEAADRQDVEKLRREQFESMHRAAELRNRLRSAEEALQRTSAQRCRVEQESASADQDTSRLREEATDLAARAQRQRETVEEQRQQCALAEQQLRDAREKLAAAVEVLAEAREQEQSAVARLRTLEDVATRFAGVSDGVRTLLTSGRASGVRTVGVVADFIEAGRDVEGVAEGYLATFLPTVIVESDADLRRASELLREAGAGRTTMISRSAPAGGPAVGTSSNGRRGIPAELLEDPRVWGRLSDRLKLRTSANGILQERLGDAVLVDSLASALDLHRNYPAADYLTPEGDVVYSSGVVAAGGSNNGDRGLLAHSRRMEEARAQSAEAASRVLRLNETTEAGRRGVERLELDLRRSRQSLEAAEHERMTLELQLERLEEETARSDRRRVVLSEELAGLGEETARSDQELHQLRGEVDEAEQAHRALEASLERRVSVLGEKTTRLRELAERVAALGAEAAAWQHRQQSIESEGRRLEESAAELEARVRALREEASAARERSEETAKSMAQLERELVERLRSRETISTKIAEMERSIGERQQRLAEQESRLRVARAELEALRAKTREAELERTKSEAARAHLDELCGQELGITAREAAEAAGDEVRAGDAAELETAIEAIKTRIEKIGPVNMTAIEEFTELEDRHRFLTEQRQDLEQSMVSLKETIRRINRSSRERFTQAFEAIRDSFHQIFKLLFSGGRADLRLEEGEDVLECGIEIMAQPPGKRLGNVQLLSGGEKALSAIALLFSVFRYQPSPFCLLDEVDAALDDANVGRFARMLREYAEQTQFIVVTHNKLSMESADLMYGVTMEEPGVSKLVSIQFE